MDHVFGTIIQSGYFEEAGEEAVPNCVTVSRNPAEMMTDVRKPGHLGEGAGEQREQREQRARERVGFKFHEDVMAVEDVMLVDSLWLSPLPSPHDV
jgi:hypothetical protein